MLVYVVHYGDPNPTRSLLGELAQLAPAPAGVFVIDNGPEPWHGDEPVVGGGQNRGYAGAVNWAFRHAKSKDARAVWILNNDVHVATGALAGLLRALNSGMAPDVVGSLVTTAGVRCWFGGGEFDERTGRATHLRVGEEMTFHRDASGVDSAIRETDWVNGCSMLIPLRSAEERGGFDENYFLYKEELEWQVRSPRAKCSLVETVLVDHLVGASTGSTAGRLGRVYMARNGYLFASAQPQWKRRAAWVACWFIDYFAVPFARGRFAAVRDAWHAWRLRRVPGHKVVELL